LATISSGRCSNAVDVTGTTRQPSEASATRRVVVDARPPNVPGQAVELDRDALVGIRQVGLRHEPTVISHDVLAHGLRKPGPDEQTRGPHLPVTAGDRGASLEHRSEHLAARTSATG
jgi:hypothetical protein